MAIYTYMDLSTAHVEQDDLVLLGDGEGPVISCYEYGAIVYITPVDERMELRDKGFSDKFCDTINYARMMGCYMLRLDADGDLINELIIATHIETTKRWQRAVAYGRIISDCQDDALFWDLEGFGLDDVLDAAGDLWSNSAEDLREVAIRACQRVAQKWKSDGETAGAAQDWALSLISEYAADAGITLIEKE